MIEFLHRDFGIDLGSGDVRMAENLTDAFDGHSIYWLAGPAGS